MRPADGPPNGEPARSEAPTPSEAPTDRFDGAGWFLAALLVALLYGLGVSAISDGSGDPEHPVRARVTTTVPVRAALVIGDGP